MMAQPNLWQKLWWWLTPLGRVRLALSSVQQTSDLTRTRARLRSALDVLRHPQRTADTEAVALLPLVLEHLVDLALRQADLSEAAAFLSDLDATGAAATVRLDLRWRLIQALIQTAGHSAALSQARLYVADASSDAERVAELLRNWLTEADAPNARQLAEAVTPHLQANGLVETLRMLCLSPEEFEDRNEGARFASRTQPDLLAPWGSLQCEAHLLRAKCAEPVGQWDQMLSETQAALSLMPDADAPRYWNARALLLNRRSGEVEAELSRPPHLSTPRWQRLLGIAALTTQPILDRVEPCLRAVEGAEGKLGKAEMWLAVTALEAALRPVVDDAHDRLVAIAAFSERLMRTVGRLPWGAYNLALKEICVDRAFERADQRLTTGVNAPPDGCPVHLLRATCAAILGRGDELAQVLNITTVPADFAGDEQFFAAVQQVFSHLQSGEDFADADTLLAALNRSAGRLVRSLPILTAIRALLQDFLTAAAGQVNEFVQPASFDVLADSAWAQWLWQRFWLTRTPIPEISAALASSAPGLLHPALLWERAAWLQEFSATLPSSLLSLMTADLTRFRESVTLLDGFAWKRLWELRNGLMMLDDQPGDAIAGQADPNPACPWWSEDNPLQTLAQQEAQIELCYLEGRRFLRRRLQEEALERFRQARSFCGETGLVSHLAAARFAPLLDYWEGVTLAHLHRVRQAREKLQACLNGPKSVEARAQLGLLAVAQGDHDAAAEYLQQIPDPKPACAKYLAALLAERQGDAAEARHWLDNIESTAPRASVYVAAAHRLHGAIEERAGNSIAAVERYRRALSCWQNDFASAARLGRIWLREAYDRIRRRENVAPEPALDGRWSAVSNVGWATLLPTLHDWLVTAAQWADRPTRLTLPPALLQSPAGAALKRLVVWTLMATGQTGKAAEVARAWAAQDAADPHLAAAVAILNGAGDLSALYLNGGGGTARAQVEALTARLAAVRARLSSDPAIVFWYDAARLLLDPALLEREQPFATVLSDGNRPPSQRALAAVVGLFSPDAAHRQRAADLCQQLLTDGAFADETTQAAVTCLTACVSGSDGDFLNGYNVIEQDLSVLPCDEAEIYVAASEARLRVGAIDDITHGFIPDSLTELTHPDVRRVIGLAYARRAARDAEKDVRAALNDLEQAMELLETSEVTT